MGKCGLIFFTATAVILGLVVMRLKPIFTVPELPKLEETWWGSRSPSHEDSAIKPFKINVPDSVLQDLKHRLEIAKPFQAPLENVNHEYGINTKLLKTIVEYWKNKYEWRQREKFLNQYPQFTVSVQGLRIHYIHIKPTNTQGKQVRPMLLLHGWPGSVREFYEMIPLMTTPQKGRDYVFELIIPSLPGYGFSEAAVRPGLGPAEMAVVFKNFMQRLGFTRYYLQGGDWGGILVQHMATLYPEKVIGVHSNMCFVNTPWSNLLTMIGSFYPPLIADENQVDKVYPLSKKYSYLMLETGYMHLQATKPDTIGAVLRETPVGLAAYILEKFITWTNPAYKERLDGALTEKYTYDKLLDNVMIYWITDSMTTSMRLYSEGFNKAQMSNGLGKIPIKIPSGCAKFSFELAYQTDTILKEKYANLIHSTDYVGGHFAAFELPKVLANDVHDFVDKTEKLLKNPSKKD